MSLYHTPVLLEESIQMLDIHPHGTYVDLTFGGGGHSAAILQRLSSKGRLVAFDQDGDAQGNIPRDSRFTFIRSNFRFMRPWLRHSGITSVDGILADLGVSSHHFDTPERGFSFRFEAPLDMRMNTGAGISAAEVVNNYSNAELLRLCRDWGQIETPFKTANCIERARLAAPIDSIGALIRAVEPCTPKAEPQKYLTKLFQALRIEVNGEMRALEMALSQSLKALSPGGRLVVISYHSLEDRMVKNFMRSGNFEGEIQKDFYGRTSSPFEVVTRKAIAPSPQEVERNPRSRSARLRAAAKI